MAIGLAALTANAGPGVFNHLGFGAGIGTSGITIEAATPITNFVNLRAGVSCKVKGDINKKAIYEPICKSRRLPKVLISWFYHAEYS